MISDSQAIFRGEELRQDGAGTPWPAFFMRSRKNGIAFEVAFWVIFKSQVRVIMPHPGSNSHGSNSVPSHRCSGDLALIANHQEPRHEQPDIDALYHAVCPVLTEKERQVLFLALGLGCEGRLSNKEIVTISFKWSFPGWRSSDSEISTVQAETPFSRTSASLSKMKPGRSLPPRKCGEASFSRNVTPTKMARTSRLTRFPTTAGDRTKRWNEGNCSS